MEPKLKKKSLFKQFREQNLYSLLVITMAMLGISYGIVFFTDTKQVSTGSLTTGLVSVNTSDDGSVGLVSTTPLSDTKGLNQVGETITIENTSNTDLDIKVIINPSSSNTLAVSNIRYGVYINNYQYKEPSTLSSTYVVYEGILLKGETIELDVNLWINESYSGTATVFTGTFLVDVSSADMLGADYIERSVNKNNGLYAINTDGTLNSGTGTIREYRYSGIDAKNYVWFNCKDGTTSGSSNCELWRIVGEFNVKGNEYQTSYRRIKIVRDENITTSTFGGTSFNSSTINTYLNGTYYNSLNNSAKKMIINAPWNIGTTALTKTPSASYTSETASVYYTKVGLLSPSDVGYTTAPSNYNLTLNNTSLLTSSWLTGKSFYTLNSNGSNIINSNGSILTTISNTTSYGIKPSVYLSPTVSIIAGNGTSEKPFELSYLETEEFYGEISIIGYVTYDTTGYDIETPEQGILYINSSITVTNEITSTTLDGFQGWSTTSGGEVVYQPGDSISESDLASGRLTLYPIIKIVPKLYNTVETTLAPYLLADDGDARIVSGSADQISNNYVWYSGKLWRIVELNNDGSVKLVTDENITTITWGTNGTYSGSWMYQWLNEDFKDTLYNYENLLVTDYQWNATQTSETTKPSETTMVEGTVGLLNTYEYVQSYSKLGTDSTAYGAGYLNNGYYWWLITPYSSSSVRYVSNSDGSALNGNPVSFLPGARPSINLKSNIEISCTECDGSKTKPYTIVGDRTNPTANELINNRVSGEYVTFDNELYRIVSIENSITKITKVDYIRDTSDTVVTKYFASSVTYGASGNTQNDNYWDYYLNNTWYNNISTNYKNMLVSGTWYLGTVGSSTTNPSYKNAICATSNTTATTKSCTKTSTVYNGYVGLGRIGEMFTSQIGGGYSTSNSIWTITPSSSSSVRLVYYSGGASSNSPRSSLYGARPSINLSSTVKIVSGLGTKESPFEISM